jgi:hypothetical protein
MKLHGHVSRRTHETMKKPVSPSRATRPTVMAIYCPLWHRYDHMDSWKGIGWNEWNLVRSAKARFPGHYQPIKPAWGCFDEADPKWSRKEIDLAADHGIDVFLVDWYWYSGVKIMEETLERGLLQAPNRKRLKFALMWANHDWADYFPAPYQKTWNQWLPSRHSIPDLFRAIDYCAEHYFGQPNYWKLRGKLFYSLFQPEKLVNELGGVKKTKAAFREIDRKLAARGLSGIHWNAMTWDAKPAAQLKRAGFDSVTSYNVPAIGLSAMAPGEANAVASEGRKAPKASDRIQQYEDIMKAHHQNWEALGGTELPHMPVVTLGWDATPRCEKQVPFPFPVDAIYPYSHVVVGNTPRRFERLCRDAQEYLRRPGKSMNVVLINAWNEWTEGSYLLPEKRYGDAYLRAVRSAFGLRLRRS